jgi:hypothetical protein
VKAFWDSAMAILFMAAGLVYLIHKKEPAIGACFLGIAALYFREASRNG